MVAGCCANCAKILLFIFNFIFWLSGAAILGVGIWLKVDPSYIYKFQILDKTQDDPYLAIAAWILIGVGAFVFIVGFFGCCGAIKESRCLLGFYIFFMLLVMAGELAVGVMTAIKKDEVLEAFKRDMKGAVLADYGPSGTLNAAWDHTQMDLQCCGVDGPADYKNVSYINGTGEVPESCCKLEEGSANEKPKFLDKVKCQTEAKNNVPSPSKLNVKGCYEATKEWFEKNSVILIGVGCGIAGLELLGFVLAVYLCCKIGREEKYHD